MAGDRELTDKLEVLVNRLLFDELEIHIDAVKAVEIGVGHQRVNQLFPHGCLFQEFSRRDALVKVIEQRKDLEAFLVRRFHIGAVGIALIVALVAAKREPGRDDHIHAARIADKRRKSLVCRLIGDKMETEQHFAAEGKGSVVLCGKRILIGHRLRRRKASLLHIPGKTAVGLDAHPARGIRLCIGMVRNHAERFRLCRDRDNAAAHARPTPEYGFMLCRPHFIALRCGLDKKPLDLTVRIGLGADIREFTKQRQREVKRLVFDKKERLALCVHLFRRKCADAAGRRVDQALLVLVPVETLVHLTLHKRQRQIDTAVLKNRLIALQFIVIEHGDFIPLHAEQAVLADAGAARSELPIPEPENHCDEREQQHQGQQGFPAVSLPAPPRALQLLCFIPFFQDNPPLKCGYIPLILGREP